MSATQSLSAILSVYDAVHTSIAQHTPLQVVYATRGVVVKERTIKPVAIEVGKKGSDLIVCDDSLRNTRITMRIDRVVAVSGQVVERY